MTCNPTYLSSGGGANYQNLTRCDEDKDFHEGAGSTLFKQSWGKIASFQSAVVHQNLMNVGLGKNMTCTLSKNPDYLGNCYTVSTWPGITANKAQGISKSSYINGRALYVNANMQFKIASTPIYQVDGQTQLILLEFFNLLKQFAEQVGYCYTQEELIESSSKPSTLYAPWIGFPFQFRPDLAFPICGFNLHQMNVDITTRHASDLIVNYDGVKFSGRGNYALPIRIDTRSAFDANSVDFFLSTECIWVSKEERDHKKDDPQEWMLKQYIKVGSQAIPANMTEQKVAVDLNIRGPVSQIFATVRSTRDSQSGNWTKLCNDNGEDYIQECMVMTGGLAREDGHKAPYYRGIKVAEAYKTTIDRHVYLFPFEKDSTVPRFTGQQNFTNVDKPQFSAVFAPHDDVLEVDVYACVYNNQWTRGGTGGLTWQLSM